MNCIMIHGWLGWKMDLDLYDEDMDGYYYEENIEQKKFIFFERIL